MILLFGRALFLKTPRYKLLRNRAARTLVPENKLILRYKYARYSG